MDNKKITAAGGILLSALSSNPANADNVIKIVPRTCENPSTNGTINGKPWCNDKINPIKQDNVNRDEAAAYMLMLNQQNQTQQQPATNNEAGFADRIQHPPINSGHHYGR